MFLKAQAPLSILVAFFTITAACTNEAVERRLSLSPAAYGPVKVGMSVAEASSVLGTSLSPGYELSEDDIYCHYVYPAGQANKVHFMVEEGLISRIDVVGEGVSTTEDISIGSTGSEVSMTYGDRLRIEPHKYSGPEGKYYIVAGPSGYEYVFEVIDNRVVEFRSGKYPSVEYVEGCL
jgi:hypothetical protein